MKALTIIGLLILLTTAQRTSPVAVNDLAPDFTLDAHNGSKVTLSDSRKKNPVVLVFYRASW